MDAIAGTALKDRLAGRVARFADRREDWTVFGFETARDPRYARAQRRYLGASGSVDPAGLRGAIPTTAFTMSIQSMPGRYGQIACRTIAGGDGGLRFAHPRHGFTISPNGAS